MKRGTNQTSTKPQRPGGARVPRASLGVSILRDPDYVALMSMGKDGQQAFAAFVSIILAAKDLGNAGQFREPLQVVAAMIRWPADELAEAIARIHSACKCNGHDPWLTVSRRGSRIIVRSFEEWNTPSKGWGGQRIGAGRKKSVFKSDSSGNQDETPPQVGRGNGESSGGGAGGTIGEAYGVAQAMAKLEVIVPANLRPGWAAIETALEAAECRGEDLAQIVSGATAYYPSPRGRGNRAWELLAFIRDGHYRDDPSAWQNRKSNDASGSTPKDTGLAGRLRAESEALDRERDADPGALARAAEQFKQEQANAIADEAKQVPADPVGFIGKQRGGSQ